MPLRVPTEAEVRELVKGLTIPEGFLVGSATSGYQCEGGYNHGNGPRNNWAEWESRPGYERTEKCAAFWDDYERDLDLAAAMDLNAHRLSVEWARVQPVRERRRLDRPPPWDEAAVDRYVDMLLAARRRGLEPIVTLHHFTHPYWAGIDLWLDDAGVDLFVRYGAAMVASVNERLLDRDAPPVTWWNTINEPYTLALATYLARAFPSEHGLDLGSPARCVRALDGMYAAHIRLYGAIHRWYEVKGLARPNVFFNNFALDFYGGDRFFFDLVLSRSRDVAWGPALKRDLVERERVFMERLEPLVSKTRAASPQRWYAARGIRNLGPRLFTPDRFPRTGEALWTCDWDRPLDVVAFDYYDATLANQLRLASGTYEPWEWEVIPEGLYDLCLAHAADDGLPVFIAENGMSQRQAIGSRAEPRPDGIRRDDFIRAHLFHLLRAMKDGVKVAGYLYWSLTDNYEWGRFSPRFGLHAVDFEDPQRRRAPTDVTGVDAASVFGAFARAVRAGDPAAIARSLLRHPSPRAVDAAG